MPRALVLLCLLAGCGPIREPECVENTVSCENRCTSQCENGEWRVVRCLPCGRSVIVQGPHNECRIEAEECVVTP